MSFHPHRIRKQTPADYCVLYRLSKFGFFVFLQVPRFKKKSQLNRWWVGIICLRAGAFFVRSGADREPGRIECDLLNKRRKKEKKEIPKDMEKISVRSVFEAAVQEDEEIKKRPWP